MSMVFFGRRLLACSVLILATFGLVAALSWRDAARADDYPPNIGCTVSTVGTTGSVTVTGTGFGVNSVVELRLGAQTVGSATARTDGSFQTTVAVPAGRTGVLTAGNCPNHGTDPASLHRDKGTSDPGAASSSTASTGFAAITATTIALALLGGGAAFVLVGRRRRAS